jgi:hypothetical protein
MDMTFFTLMYRSRVAMARVEEGAVEVEKDRYGWLGIVPQGLRKEPKSLKHARWSSTFFCFVAAIIMKVMQN